MCVRSLAYGGLLEGVEAREGARWCPPFPRNVPRPIPRAAANTHKLTKKSHWIFFGSSLADITYIYEHTLTYLHMAHV